MPRLPQKFAASAWISAALMLFTGRMPAQNVEGGHVTAVRYWSLGDVTRIAIETDTEFEIRSDHLDNPDRLFFDVVGTIPRLGRKGMNVIPVSDRFVKQIRIAETQRSITRVVLDLESAVEFTTSRLENPERLIIELHAPSHTPAPQDLSVAAKAPAPDTVGNSPVQPATLQSAVAIKTESTIAVKPERPIFQPPAPSASRALAQPKPVAVALLGPPPLIEIAPNPAPRIPGDLVRINAPVPPAPSGRSSAVLVAKTGASSPDTVLGAAAAPVNLMPVPSPAGPIVRAAASESAVPARSNSTGERSMVRVLGLKVGKVVLDAGHGGHDTGTVGPNGLEEKDLVLDVTKRLGALIEQRLGSEVIYTRTDDTFIPLERRTEIANEAKADLFLSIHANSSTVRLASGVETFYLSFTTSKDALDVAARENASSETSVYELQDLLQKIALKDKVDESREFATRIQDSLFSASAKTNVRAKDRGVRKAPFVVLIGASMPSVLAEIGFISNAHDESLMKRGEHRQKIAEALYKGLASYAGTLSHFQVAQRRP